MINRAGAGVDTIDVAHCSKQGVFVTNCPGKNAHAVAELALGLILAIDRRIYENVHLLKEGRWNKGAYVNCSGIKGKTLGLIGFGSIAQAVAIRARAFDMNVLVFTRTRHEECVKKFGIQYANDLEDLLSRSDIVSLHTPSTKDTVGLVNSQFLATMKDDAILINTARGNVINDEALLAKLDASPNFWYGADVYNGEPAGKEGAYDNPIARHPHVYGTHHIGASTK
jgi:D-3-phosphoglycerate dehydrogenase